MAEQQMREWVCELERASKAARPCNSGNEHLGYGCGWNAAVHHDERDTVWYVEEEYQPGEWEQIQGPEYEEGMLLPEPGDRVVRVDRVIYETRTVVP